MEVLSPTRRTCVAIREADAVRLEGQIRLWHQTAGFLELRLDYVKPSDLTIPNLKKWVGLSSTPLIATLRRRANGGKFLGSPSEQVQLLMDAVEAGVAFVDLEIETVEQHLKGDMSCLRKGPNKLIVSYHNFEETPADLEAVFERLVAVRPDIVKIATEARSFSDGIRLMDLLEPARKRGLPVITVAMGELGAYTRIVAPVRGSLLTYASTEPGSEPAPGQISVEDLQGLYDVDHIDSQTRMYGVIGYPIGHSLSPYIHNPAFRAEGLNCRYLPLAIPMLSDFIPHLSQFSGLSITIPHKVAVLNYIADRDSSTLATGAANTLVREKDRFCAYNTDVYGIRFALRGPLQEGMERVTLLGAGGAARAAAVVLKEAGCRVTVLARDLSKANSFANEFGFECDLLDRADGYRGDLLINSTPVGMNPNAEDTPVGAGSIRYRYVFDMVYNPVATRLIREAEQRKAITISGAEMFVAQAARQFELWTGLPGPIAQMREIAFRKLEHSQQSATLQRRS